jgi:hypothetical protein
MANAIEHSHCVLMCMTEAYKQSANCRAEAEYAFSLKKPIIPLIMQSGYKPTGWLGIILGSKIFVDFTKYEFAECIKRLFKEFGPLFGSKKHQQQLECRVETQHVQIEKIKPPVDQKVELMVVEKNNEVSGWSEVQVAQWFEEKGFNALMLASVMPCDGGLLEQYYLMSQSVPEFFFKSLNPNGAVSLRECALFAKELRLLFK